MLTSKERKLLTVNTTKASDKATRDGIKMFNTWNHLMYSTDKLVTDKFISILDSTIEYAESKITRCKRFNELDKQKHYEGYIDALELIKCRLEKG